MRRFFVFILLASPFLISCAHEYKPYTPVNSYEKTELPRASLDVYPDDVRTNVNHYTNTIVAWAGIIQETRARDLSDKDYMRAVTVLEHHYFDWEENREGSRREYLVSPRGEGRFRVEWDVRRKNPEATTADVEKYAAPGRLAIVYGTPESVSDDGVITLKYRYIRIIDPSDFTLRSFSYGRTGEPYRYIGK